jgi:hypothetical protein
LPPCRSLGGLRPDAVGVVAEGDVELRPVPERAVDEVRGPWITQRVDVDLQRLQHRLRRLLQAAEDCVLPTTNPSRPVTFAAAATTCSN